MVDDRVERDRAMEVEPPSEPAEPQLRSVRPEGSTELANRLKEERSADDASDATRLPAREGIETLAPEQRGPAEERDLQERLVDTGESKPEGPSAVLDEADRSALKDYTADGYREINPALRDESTPVPLELERRAESVSRALEKLPPAEGMMYRGADLTPEQISSYEPGTVVEESAFTSTSSSPESAFAANTRLYMESRNGRDISEYSTYQSENEVLFDRGTHFQVLSNEYDETSGTTEIYLREV